MKLPFAVFYATFLPVVANSRVIATLQSGTSPKNHHDSKRTRGLFSSRIIGGVQASQGEFPFFVDWDEGHCGATLIWPDIILSAAHCNDDKSNDVLVGAFEDWVASGVAVFRTITARVPHPNYNSHGYNYNFLVMKLDSAVPSSITPVTLNRNANYPNNDQLLTITGLGTTLEGSGSYPTFLRKADVPYVDTQTCINDLGVTLDPTIKLCAGYPQGGTDTCQGDSGGPILDSNDVQVGVTSYGYGCGDPETPGIYARVSGVIDWIDQQVCALSAKPPSSCSGGNPAPTMKPTVKPATVPVHIPPGFCFSKANTVEVANKGVVAMKELQVGEKVKDAGNKMTTVYSFGHYHRSIKAEYLQIHAQGLAKPLEISKDHLMFVNGAAKPASSISVGDMLDVATENGSATVIKIRSVMRQGAYAPFTTSGTIMVSNVAASSYVTLQENSSVLVMGGKYKTSLSMHWLAHLFQTPHRLTCMLSMSYCKSETYTEVGISKWVDRPLHMFQWLVVQNVVVMALFVLPMLCLGLMLCVMEACCIHWQLVLVCVAVFLLPRLIRVRKTKRKVV